MATFMDFLVVYLNMSLVYSIMLIYESAIFFMILFKLLDDYEDDFWSRHQGTYIKIHVYMVCVTIIQKTRTHIGLNCINMYWPACVVEFFSWLIASHLGYSQAWTTDCGCSWRSLPVKNTNHHRVLSHYNSLQESSLLVQTSSYMH